MWKIKKASEYDDIRSEIFNLICNGPTVQRLNDLIKINVLLDKIGMIDKLIPNKYYSNQNKIDCANEILKEIFDIILLYKLES
jgi:hypothetical protein